MSSLWAAVQSVRPAVRTLASLAFTASSGVMLGLSFQPGFVSNLAWVALVPIARALRLRDHVFEAYVGAYLAGLFFNLITTDWIRTLDGGNGWAGSSAPDWLFQSEVLATFWPATLLVGRTCVKAVPLPMSVALPIVWVTHEFLVRYMSALVDKTGWPLYLLGYSIADYGTLRQIADLSGISAISVLIASFNGGLWDVLQFSMSRRAPNTSKIAAILGVAVPAILIVSALLYGAWRIGQTNIERGPSVCLMPPDSLDKEAERQASMEIVVRDSHRPDLLLWSETDYDVPIRSLDEGAGGNTGSHAAGENSFTGSSSVRVLEDFARQVGSLVVGCKRHVGTGSELQKYNSVAFVDPEAGCAGLYDKVWLVPGAEFMPYAALTDRRTQGYTHGTSYPVFKLRSADRVKEFRFSASVCYDIAFPELYRRFMRSAEGAPDFFVVCSAEGSDGTGQMARHLLAVARLRAVECRRAIVRNVNCGYSGVIDSTGQSSDQSIEWKMTKPTPVGRVPIDHRQSLFVLLGDWLSTLAVAAVGAVCCWTVCGRVRHFKRRRLSQAEGETPGRLPAKQ